MGDNLVAMFGSIVLSGIFYLAGCLGDKGSGTRIKVSDQLENIVFPFIKIRKDQVRDNVAHMHMLPSLALCGMAEFNVAIAVIYVAYAILKRETVSSQFLFLFNCISSVAALFGSGALASILEYKYYAKNKVNLFFSILGSIEFFAFLMGGLALWFGWL